MYLHIMFNILYFRDHVQAQRDKVTFDEDNVEKEGIKEATVEDAIILMEVDPECESEAAKSSDRSEMKKKTDRVKFQEDSESDGAGASDKSELKTAMGRLTFDDAILEKEGNTNKAVKEIISFLEIDSEHESDGSEMKSKLNMYVLAQKAGCEEFLE